MAQFYVQVDCDLCCSEYITSYMNIVINLHSFSADLVGELRFKLWYYRRLSCSIGKRNLHTDKSIIQIYVMLQHVTGFMTDLLFDWNSIPTYYYCFEAFIINDWKDTDINIITTHCMNNISPRTLVIYRNNMFQSCQTTSS